MVTWGSLVLRNPEYLGHISLLHLLLQLQKAGQLNAAARPFARRIWDCCEATWSRINLWKDGQPTLLKSLLAVSSFFGIDIASQRVRWWYPVCEGCWCSKASRISWVYLDLTWNSKRAVPPISPKIRGSGCCQLRAISFYKQFHTLVISCI
jgi:hypothetical protein